MSIKLTGSFVLVLATILSISSCRKQEATESTISFSFPAANAKLKEYTTIPLVATIKDDDNILSVFWYLEGPSGDTINIFAADGKNPEFNGGKSIRKTQYFTHSRAYSTGTFKWHVFASNKYKTVESVRTFQIGDSENIVNSFVIAGMSNNSSSMVVKLYDKDLKNFNQYEIDNTSVYLSAFLGTQIFNYDRGRRKITTWNGLTGKNQQTLQFSAYSDSRLISQENMYIFDYRSNPSYSIFDQAGTRKVDFASHSGKTVTMLEVGEKLFTVEKDFSGSSRYINTYNTKTGSLELTLRLPSAIDVRGMFSFGDINRVYFLARDPLNSSRTVFWFYNKALNSVTQLSVILNGAVVNQNPVRVANDKVWIFGSTGLFEFNKSDQLFQKVIESTARSLGNTGIYSYHAKEQVLMYYNSGNYYVFDYATQKQIGRLTGSASYVMLK